AATAAPSTTSDGWIRRWRWRRRWRWPRADPAAVGGGGIGDGHRLSSAFGGGSGVGWIRRQRWQWWQRRVDPAAVAAAEGDPAAVGDGRGWIRRQPRVDPVAFFFARVCFFFVESDIRIKFMSSTRIKIALLCC
ncbi:Os09g0519200, partial [Oryza sativa Japonica Group]